jgi:diguanylate cyclase (GGDEF)-like protein
VRFALKKRSRAEQLQEQARALNVVHRGNALGRITLSLGVAVFPKHGLATDDLLRAADTALYRAKENGRARVEVA